MEKYELIEEIMKFGFDYGLFNIGIDKREIKTGISYMLDDCEFLENLINTIILKSKYGDNSDKERIKVILLELEKIRLELEYEVVIQNKH